MPNSTFRSRRTPNHPWVMDNRARRCGWQAFHRPALFGSHCCSQFRFLRLCRSDGICSRLDRCPVPDPGPPAVRSGEGGTSKDYCAEVKGMKALGLTEIMRAWW